MKRVAFKLEQHIELFVFCFLCQERRKIYEANLEKVGLELETEDKSVRALSSSCDYHSCVHHFLLSGKCL